MEKRTLILLSAPRCGSTAILRMFQKHPDVGICDLNQGIGNCEPHFWNIAAKAIEGNPDRLFQKMRTTLPHISLPDKYTEDSMFKLWDSILEAQGPIVFDKSPYYLGNREAMQLLCNYIQKGNDVRIFAVIRDPRDAITSQYELFTAQFKESSPKIHEELWIDRYTHLEEIRKSIGYLPIFRYEDFSAAPSCYAPIIFNFCGIRHLSYTYDHIKPTNIGRKPASLYPGIRRWKMSKPFKQHLEKYGYLDKGENIIIELLRFFKMLPGNMYRVIVSIVKIWNIRYYKKNG